MPLFRKLQQGQEYYAIQCLAICIEWLKDIISIPGETQVILSELTLIVL